MKPAACRALRRKLAADQPTVGLWVTLESPSITEMAVALGLDWVVIDAEHSLLDWKEIADHLRATVRSDTVAFVRIAEASVGLVKRALDLGADGVIVPWVETADQLADIVRFARYPLDGVRGIGADRATAWGQAVGEHTAEANEHVFVIPIVETVRGAKNLDELLGVHGVELIQFGPADFSASHGFRGQWEGPGVADAILHMKDRIRAAGKHCGIVATSDANVRTRIDQGFRAIGLGMDSTMLIRSLRNSLASIGRDRSMRADLTVPAIETRVQQGPRPFRVAVTGDFHDASGAPKYRDFGLSVFDGTPITVTPFREHRPIISADQLAGVNGVIVLTPRVEASSLKGNPDLLAVGRFGVGYDSVDVPACTAADVMLVIASGAVDRSVAEATVGWMIALSHHVRTKDLLVREGRWDERSQFMGRELRDQTLGVIGFGGIGQALVGLLAGFGMNPPLVYDPFARPEAIAKYGARAVGLEELLAQADFVSIHCPLNDATRNLIGRRELALMRPSAYLLNTARGGIVNEDALEAALAEKQIAGAALDCFEMEPVTTPSRFRRFDNLLLAPHSIAWTDELFRDIGRAVCGAMVDLASGRVPRGVVNPDVIDRPGFQAKWKRIQSGYTQPIGHDVREANK